MRDAPGQLFFEGDGRVTCRGCGRLLRSEAYLQRGYGKGCWRKRSGRKKATEETKEPTTKEQSL